MKELSIKEKARAYDEAINRAKSKIKNDKDHVLYEDDILEIFPELKENRVEKPNGGIVLEDLNEGDGFYKVNLAYLSKEQVEEIESLVKKWNPESEDERIRKELIKLLRNLFNNYSYFIKDPFYTECIAWLKKQGKQSNEEPQVYETRDGEVITYSESKGYKVAEPKFKFGDWIILTAGELSVTLQIINVDINRERYWFNDGSYLPFADEECMHLWTINDAKAGDVLYYSDDTIVIFKYFHDDSSFCSYCYIDGGVFYTSNDRTPVWWVNNVFYPATEEQRDILFQKMKESGYEWDANKKEINKVIKYESKKKRNK